MSTGDWLLIDTGSLPRDCRRHHHTRPLQPITIRHIITALVHYNQSQSDTSPPHSSTTTNHNQTCHHHTHPLQPITIRHVIPALVHYNQSQSDTSPTHSSTTTNHNQTCHHHTRPLQPITISMDSPRPLPFWSYSSCRLPSYYHCQTSLCLPGLVWLHAR